jgi:hypothetical protein
VGCEMAARVLSIDRPRGIVGPRSGHRTGRVKTQRRLRQIVPSEPVASKMLDTDDCLIVDSTYHKEAPLY